MTPTALKSFNHGLLTRCTPSRPSVCRGDGDHHPLGRALALVIRQLDVKYTYRRRHGFPLRSTLAHSNSAAHTSAAARSATATRGAAGRPVSTTTVHGAADDDPDVSAVVSSSRSAVSVHVLALKAHTSTSREAPPFPSAPPTGAAQ